jgi:hypothetical protein
MKICYLPLLIILAVCLLVFACLWLTSDSFSVNASSVTITAEVIAQCGDSVIEYGEQCEGEDLNGQTCEGLGFSGGILECVNCMFDTSGCTEPAGGPPSPSISPYVTPVVIFEGKASPQSTVTLLKDAQIVATTKADGNANFRIVLSGLSSGDYVFGVYSKDSEGVTSSLLTFFVNVIKGTTTKVSGVFIAPTIETDKEEVEKGEDILIFGQSVPGAEIRILIKSEGKEISVSTIADSQGRYSYSLNTTLLDFGRYQVTATAFFGNLSSNVSKIVDFIVGTKTIFKKELPECPPIGDFNNDCLVDLIDFSILIYWFERPNPPAYIDLSEDGRIDLVDFSIMAYYWTG